MQLTKKEETTPHTPRPEKRKPRDTDMSPLALRRAYLPRPRPRTRPPQAHPAAAAAAGAAQVQPPNFNIRLESQTTQLTTPSRIPKLTRFKPEDEINALIAAAEDVDTR